MNRRTQAAGISTRIRKPPFSTALVIAFPGRPLNRKTLPFAIMCKALLTSRTNDYRFGLRVSRLCSSPFPRTSEPQL
jgi:hypothetical protein